MAYAATKERAHELIERMVPEQMPAAVEFLERMAQPRRRTLDKIPFEDEEISPEEEEAAAAAKASGYVGSLTSHEELLKELGLTLEDFDRMAHEPIETEVEATRRG